MKPKLIHQEAMDYSFKAKQALERDNYSIAFDLFNKAADLESQVAEFYFDKPDLEPTRSIIIRSAAYLNIKAGQIEQAKKFIFFGLLHTTDALIKEQLNNALELAVSLGNMAPNEASKEFNYLNLLRQRSIHYVIEPANLSFGHSVSLESIKEFSESYLKSIKAYAISKFKRVLKIEEELEQNILSEIEKLVNPLVTSSAYGSFKFSIANDFLPRTGDNKELVEIKANVVTKYHHEIFINPLSDEDIQEIKKAYSEDEVNDIFRPLTKIKSNNTPYKVGYYDTEDFNKKFVSKIVNKQKQKLITVKQITQEDIGELESSLVHKRSGKGGRTSKQVIFKEQMKTAEYEIKVSEIIPKENNPLLLSEEIMVNMTFDSNKGFTFSFPDLNVQNTDTAYNKALEGFYNTIYGKIIGVINAKEPNEEEQRDWNVVKKLITNPDALKK
ncbi:hypothetical protein [Flavobacterium filum]|uniref:hypothetical protein n=1 Tax=Flavobacterium filum TaxID=370974 RepID=UPI0023F255B4|nr:hypothetical protein [Flavobacterium filum]